MSRLPDFVSEDWAYGFQAPHPRTGEIMDVQFNQRFDRIDHFSMLGMYMLKVVSNEGFLEFCIDSDEGERVSQLDGVIAVEREEMLESEYEIYLRWQVGKLAIEDFLE